ncbi:MAG TPA: DsbA family oxidoreductase [Acidimicrobiales bacterium]|nr:DsbA family oxidoreductase [Acidimicrobiales bacterium]
MSDALSIDLWADVVCPFCYLGSRQLALAIAQFDHEVQVAHRAFELDPNAPASTAQSYDEILAAKYQMPVERARALHRRLEDQGKELGITFSFDTVRRANSFDAHRLIALASSQGLGDATSARLFRAYFTDGALISDRAVLRSLANEVGVVDVEDLWSGDAFAASVRRDETAAHDLNISGVPAFLINRRVVVLGAQGAEHVADALGKAWASRSA